MDANEEFRDLLRLSGWSQAEASRQLELTSADVSRYVNGIHPPDKQTLRLFRILLAGVEPGDAPPRQHLELHDRPDPATHDDLLAELDKLKEQLHSVTRAAERMQPKKSSVAAGTGRLLKKIKSEVEGNPLEKKSNSDIAYEKHLDHLGGKVSYRRPPSKKSAVPKRPAPSENETP